MVEKFRYKGMKIVWLMKFIGFSYDNNVGPVPYNLLETAKYGFRICLFRKGFGIHRNYKAFRSNLDRLTT